MQEHSYVQTYTREGEGRIEEEREGGKERGKGESEVSRYLAFGSFCINLRMSTFV